MKRVLCSLVLVGAAMGMRSDHHGNNPMVVQDDTLALMTYLYLVAPDAYDGVMAADPVSPLLQCINAAIITCGEGNVCYVCVVNDTVCSFHCRDGAGECPPPPACGPDPDPMVW